MINAGLLTGLKCENERAHSARSKETIHSMIALSSGQTTQNIKRIRPAYSMAWEESCYKTKSTKQLSQNDMSSSEPSCPKCKNQMERRFKEGRKLKPNQNYFFSQWDFCRSCGHVQHYEKYKTKVTRSQRHRGEIPKPPRRIPRMTYQQYMGSAYWKSRRERYFQTFGEACAVCGSTNEVRLHHKRYKPSTFGREPDGHLVTLCNTHHHEFHSLHGVEGDMMRKTDIYIQHARQLQGFEEEQKFISQL